MHVIRDLEGRQRVDAWRSHGDVSALWPGIPLQAIRLAHTRIAAVTASLLRQPTSTAVLEASEETDVSAIGIAAFHSGMGPLLGFWIERGRLDADPGTRTLLAEHLRHGRIRAQTREHHLVRLLRAFRAGGLVPIVLKGTFTAKRYFPEPGTRPASDIDLLIRPSELARAGEILLAAGFLEDCAVRAPGRTCCWRMRDQKGPVRSLEMDHADNPWSVDLHIAIDQQYFRGLKTGYGTTPWENAEPWEIGAEKALVLSQPLRSAHLAQHASRPIDVTRLIRVVELVAVLRQDLAAGSLDWGALAGILTKTGLWRFVYPAFQMAECLTPGLLDMQFHQRLVSMSTPRCRRIVDRVVANGFQAWSDRRIDEKLMWSRGPREFALNVFDLMVPDGVPVKRMLSVQAKRARMLFRRAA